MNSDKRPTSFLVVLGVLAAASGCREEGIRAYRAPKDPVPSAPAQAPAPAAAGVVWTPPPGWIAVQSNQSMRVATFSPGEGMPEVVLSSFPGDTGGLLANVNRWREQVGLGPIDAAQLAAQVPTTVTDGVSMSLVDLAGAAGQQMLGAVVVLGDGRTWFVKATGEPAKIGAIRPDFIDFARSIRVKASTSMSMAEGAPMLAAPDASGAVQDRLRAWTPPAHWKADPNASSIVAAAFDASNPEGGAKVTATMLLNSGGGALPNINRWRDQLGLPAVERLEQQPITDLGSGNLIVDLASADGARRMLAAIVTVGPQTWYYKMTGAPGGVEAERGHFERLVRAVGLGEKSP